MIKLKGRYKKGNIFSLKGQNPLFLAHVHTLSYYSSEHVMLIDEGITSSPSRNSSPDLILTISNPNIRYTGRNGHLEVPDGIPIPIATSIFATDSHEEAELRTPSRVKRAHDDHHIEYQEKEEPSPLIAPEMTSPISLKRARLVERGGREL